MRLIYRVKTYYLDSNWLFLLFGWVALQRASISCNLCNRCYKEPNEIEDPNCWQLKEMAERVPEEEVACSYLDTNGQMSNDTNRPSNGSSVTSITSPKSDSSDNSTTPPLSNGTKAQVQKSERVIQDEPGVYITLVSLSNGVNELRRVRFR